MLSTNLENYIEQYTSEEDDVLKKIHRETYLNVLQPHMLSGAYQGVLLQQLSLLKQPKYILEIGTFTGYSALCLAKGLREDGQLHTIDVNEELMEKTQETFQQSEYAGQIIQHIGDAKEIIKGLNNIPFEFVFIDADKASYTDYFDLIVDQMPSGGLILADNVLWKGGVLEEQKSKKAQILDNFNQKVQKDMRVLNCLLPIRDGLMLMIKK